MNPVQGPPTNLTGFNGMYRRGAFTSCPPDHLTDCYNCIFPGESQVTLRETATVQNSLTAGRTVIDFAIAQLSGGACLLTLNSNGTFYNETVGPTSLGTFVGADSFVALNSFGRTFISFKADGRALSGGLLYFLANPGTSLQAAATARPITTPTLTEPVAGIVEIGDHNIAVCYETATGYLSPPCIFATIASSGGKNIHLASVPVSGAGNVVARVIVASKSNETEMYFIPGVQGRIPNNSATTADIDFYNSDLSTSADYLYDLMESVPACSAMRFYSGRLILIGQTTTPDTILISEKSDPESFNTVSGYVNLPVDNGLNSCSSGAILRDTLYVMKPAGTWAIQDNGDVPNTWAVSQVDTGLGAYENGVSTFASALSGQDVHDTAFVLHRQGLLMFNGSYSAVPLTWKIEDIWQRVDSQYLHRAQIAHDIRRKRVYIAAPLDPPVSVGLEVTPSASNKNRVILMMDYSNGLSPTTVKWTIWYSTAWAPISRMAMESFTTSYTGSPIVVYQLAVCNETKIIFKFVPMSVYYPSADVNAAGTPVSINQYIYTSLVGTNQGVDVFTMLDLSILGHGTIGIAVTDKRRNVAAISYTGFNLTAYVGVGAAVNLQRLINFQSEAMQIRIVADQSIPSGFNGYFSLDMVKVYHKFMWMMRPQYLERL